MKRERDVQFRIGVMSLCAAESLEPRQLLSGSDALDRLNFGNLASEAAHHFDPGVAQINLPLLRVGTVGASAGLTYRDPTLGQELVFTLADDPNRQNYFTVKFWGNNAPATVTLATSADTVINTLEYAGGAVIYPNRFYYYTYAIPIASTSGVTSVQLHLDIAAPGKPVYSVFTSTNPAFVPDSGDASGTAPPMTGLATLTTLTAAKAVGTTSSPGILLANRQAIYGSGGTYSQVLADQITTANAPNAPAEVIGLDLFTNVSTWVAANPNATADQWRQQIAQTEAGAGYTAFPDELLSMLTSTYLLTPFTDSNGNAVSGLDDYHDPALITKIVSAIDGASYEQDSDGGFIQQGADAAANSAWTGLTSTARTTGAYVGSSARQYTTHGGGDLQGFDTYSLGWSLLSLLNDPTAAPILESYLTQSYDANLTGNSSSYVLRATAYERMLFNAVQFYQGATGGTESQNTFQESAMYACDVALAKLQSLYPNSSYPANSFTALTYVKELMGLIQDTNMRGVGFDDNSPYAASTVPNYGLTLDGFGEAHGAISTGFDGGGYGQMLPSLAPRIVQIANWDTAIDAGTLASFEAIANNTINSFDHFMFPMDNASVNSSGVLTADTFSFNAEPYITYRDPKNLNTYAGTFNFDAQYPASNPAGPIDNAYALRAAYLETQYGVTPILGFTGGYTGTSSLDFLRNLPAYESTIRSLINVSPSTLTPLPGEPGQPDFAFADVQAGAVAIMNHGDRLYVNLDWRNYEYNNNTFVNIVPSQQARFDYSNGTTELAGQVLMPSNSATVQSDGNLTGLVDPGAKVLRFGNYLMVLNDSTATYNAMLPVGTGLAEDLISHNVYSMSISSSTPTIVSVAAGQAAIFWLNASGVISSLGTGVDVGAVGVVGSDSYSNGTYTLTGAGTDIGETADAFHFVPIGVNGNETITAQVFSQTASSSLAQAGVMLRDGTSATAAFAAVLRTTGGGVRFVYRTTAGAAASWVAMPDPLTAVYAKLTRSGNNISGYESSDGINWTQIGSTQSITMSNPEIGFAVSSHSTTATSTATFGNVTVEAGVAPTVAIAASSSATTVAGTTVSLSALGADPGGASNLTYTWALFGTPPDQVSYNANGTNAAQNTTVIFSAAGTYNFAVFIQNASGAYVVGSVSVTVNQTLTSVFVSPTTALVPTGSTQLFYVTESDQFGMPMRSPAAITWSVGSGAVGSIDQSGLYTAPASGGGSATVIASCGTLSGTSSVTIQTVIGSFTQMQAINTSPAGSASYNTSTGAYAVTGSGSDIYGTSDQFQYVYETLTGDGTITAYVASVTDTNMWTKTGVMFRDSLAANGAYAFLMTTPTTTEGNAFQYRSSDGGSAAQNVQTNGTGTGGPGWVRLVRAGNMFTAYLSTNGTTWTVYGTSLSISMPSTIYVGLVVCSHLSGSLATATFTNVSVTSSTRTFAANQDIGNPSPAGSYSESGGINTLTAGGADIWSTSDQFQYGYNEVTGSGSLTIEVDSVTDTNASTKAGIMLRNTLAANSSNVALFVTPSDGIEFQWRSSAGGTTSQSVVTGRTAPYWVRLTDSSNSFTAFYSANGTTWTQLGSAETVAMNADMFAGVALTAHDSGTLATATFNNSTSTFASATIPPPALSKAAAASANPVTGTSVILSAIGTDTIEGSSNLIYTWYPLGEPPDSMAFSANGTNAAASTTVTFTAASTYLFQVDVQDPNGLQTTSNVSVTVNQTFTSIAITPAAPTLGSSATQQFTAVALDQFGNAMASQASFTWSLSSGTGSITSAGLYTSPMASGSATIEAASASVNGTSNITITNQPPLLATSSGASAGIVNATNNTAALSVLAVDDGGQSNLSYTWAVTGTPPLPVTFAPNGTNAAQNTVAAFSAIGTYTLQVTITDSAGLSVSSTVIVTVNTILGASGNDTIRLVRSGANLVVYTNGSSYSVPYTSLGAITVAGGAGTDSVNVDFSGGATPVQTAGLTVNGTGGVDTLTVTGTSGSDTASINANTIAFDSSPIIYTSVQSIIINGNGGSDTLTQTAQPGNAAALAFNSGIGGGPSAADTLAVNAGSFTFPAPVTGQGILPLPLYSLSIGSGASVAVASAAAHSDRWLLGLNSLSIAGATGQWTGQLDLGANDLVVHNGSIGTLTNQIASGYSLGSFTGTGITSSAARNDASRLTTLGVLLNNSGLYSSFDGQAVTATDVLVKYTYYGDANLDGKVDGSDYSRIDYGYLSQATGWFNGDFNDDGAINGSDYTLIDNAFNTQGASLVSAIAAPATELDYLPRTRSVSTFRRTIIRSGVMAVPTFSNTQITEQSFEDTQISSVDSWQEIDADSLHLNRRRSSLWCGS